MQPSRIDEPPVIGSMSAVPVTVTAPDEGDFVVHTSVSTTKPEVIFLQMQMPTAGVATSRSLVLDVVQLAKEFEQCDTADDALVFLQRWGAFMPPEPDERGSDLDYRLLLPYSCFVAWQEWFAFERTGGWEFTPVESLMRRASMDPHRAMFPPEFIPFTKRRQQLARIGRDTRILNTLNPRDPFVIDINAVGIADVLGSVAFAERVTRLRRVRCKGCRRTFVPDGKRTTFHDEDCGLRFHKREWARRKKSGEAAK